MDWINVKCPTLRSAEFIGADLQAKGTWLCVMGYCVEQENAGCIAGAANWEDRQWALACGVTADDVKQAYPLITQNGDDILVLAYPSEQESEVKAKRKAARSTNAKRYAPPVAQSSLSDHRASTERDGSDKEATSLTPSVKKGKEREGKGTGSLDFLVELFLGCHPSCSACPRMGVENILRNEDPENVKEAIEAFSKQWAGSNFPASSPPLKEFSKYLRNAAGFRKKNKKGADQVTEDRPPRFEGRSADEP